MDLEMKERQEFEESNYTRVNLSREQKKRLRQANLALQRGHKMGEFNEFDSLSQLVQESERISKQVVDEDQYGNRFKRVKTVPRNAGKKGKKRH